MKHNVRMPYLAFVGLTLAAVLAGACGSATAVPPTAAPATVAPAATTGAANTEAPTAAAAVQLGTADHPLIMALAPSATTDTLIASGNQIAALLSKQTGLTIKAVVPTNYQAMIQAMCSGNGQIGYLPPFAYLVAHQQMAKDA